MLSPSEDIEVLNLESQRHDATFESRCLIQSGFHMIPVKSRNVHAAMNA